MIAVMWTALFGMAVVAVDFGYLYTKKRGLQSVADSSLKAAMPVYRTQGVTAAQTRARDIARLSGYEDGVRDTTVRFAEPAVGTQFKVTIGRMHPTFFGGIFGMIPRSIEASATGMVTTGAGSVAIHANDTRACGLQWDWGVGIEVTGSGLFTVNGDVESMNKIHIGNPSATCNGTNCRITGTVTTPCTFWNDAGAGVMGAPAAVAASPPDPLAANTLATLELACSPGYSTTTVMGALPWVAGPCVGGSSLPTGVYCSSDHINVAPPFGTTICPSIASFISAGTVGITGNGAITLTAAPGTNGIIAFSNAGLGGPAIQLSNGPAIGQYTLNGSIYAPFGLVNVGTGTPGFNMTGILDGFAIAIAMGPGQPWTFNPPSGGLGGGGWAMLN